MRYYCGRVMLEHKGTLDRWAMSFSGFAGEGYWSGEGKLGYPRCTGELSPSMLITGVELEEVVLNAVLLR